MNSSPIAFIVNPEAGKGRCKKLWPEIESLIRSRLGSYKIYMTNQKGAAPHMVLQAVADGARVLVGVGGDGALNEIVNGIMEMEKPWRKNIALGFIPCGSACDFIKTAPIPASLPDAVEVIRQFRLRPIDLGELSFYRNSGKITRRYFANITSFGLGGEVAGRVNQGKKFLNPFFSFMCASLVSIALYKKKRITLNIDGKIIRTYEVLNVIIANGRYHGGGMFVAPKAQIDDGLFDITVVKKLMFHQVLTNLPKLYNGKIRESRKVETFRAKNIAAVSGEDVIVEVDGEQPGRLPLNAQIAAGALNLITA